MKIPGTVGPSLLGLVIPFCHLTVLPPVFYVCNFGGTERYTDQTQPADGGKPDASVLVGKTLHCTVP